MKHSRLPLPHGFHRRDGLVLGSRARAQRVAASERARAEMYRAIEVHLGSAESRPATEGEIEGLARAARRSAPRPLAPAPATRRKPVTIEQDPQHRARNVEEIAARLEQAEAAAAELQAAMVDVRMGVVPDVEHMADVDVVVIDNPLDHSVRPGKAPALVSLRNDPVGRMAKRRQITTVQLQAARRWQELREASEVGGAKAIDYGKEPVDGGRMHDAFDEGRLGVARIIRAVDLRLGYEGAVLVRKVLAEKLELTEVAKLTGADRRVDAEYIGRRFRECLDTIARFFGYGERAKGADRKSPMDEALGLSIEHAEKMRAVPQATARENRERARGHEWNWQPRDP